MDAMTINDRIQLPSNRDDTGQRTVIQTDASKAYTKTTLNRSTSNATDQDRFIKVKRSTNRRRVMEFFEAQQYLSDNGSFVVDLDDLRYPLPGQSMLKVSGRTTHIRCSYFLAFTSNELPGHHCK
jgi:hypothetical protein